MSRLGAADLADLAAPHAYEIARTLLGEPTFPSRVEPRWGSKGSLAVVIATSGRKRAGSYFDHERTQGGDMLDLVREHLQCPMPEAMDWLRRWLGVDDRPGTDWQGKAAAARAALPPAPTEAELAAEEARRIGRGVAIYDEGRAPDEWVIPYLRGRKIDPKPEWLADIRFHPACPFMDGDGALVRRPAMVALMRDARTGKPTGSHRTALRDDCGMIVRDKSLPKKMMGRRDGSVIMLSAMDEPTLGLGIGEGIETCLSVLSIGWAPVWAALSAGGVASFPILDGVEHLTVFADNDAAGTGQDDARNCARRWAAAGKRAAVRVPRQNDFNDALSDMIRREATLAAAQPATAAEIIARMQARHSSAAEAAGAN